MATSLDWNADEEKARERRIAERRARVLERLRGQQQHAASKQGNGSASQRTGGEQQPASTSSSGAAKGKAQATASAEAVRMLLGQHKEAVEGVRAGAEQRCEVHRAACDVEEAELREQVAAETEASRRENRAIDLEWEQLQSITAPQEYAAGIAAVSAHCSQVIQSKEGVVAAVRTLLARRDEQFVRLLREQAQETDALIAAMHAQHLELRTVQEAELDAAEAAYLQERSELLAEQKTELDVLLERRSAAEGEFMEQYLAACEQYENELEKLRVEGLQEHGTLRRKLEAEVASLEAHLDGIKAAYMLNADKLDYNYRVLVERERESKEALMQQKRKITRQWEVLNRLRKRHGAAESRAAAENARLTDEYQHVTRAFNHLQSKFRHFKAADLARFEQVCSMKEEELGELLEKLVEAEAFISSFVVGLPQPSTAAEAEGQVQGSAGDASSQGLELVGRAVAVDPQAAAAAAAAEVAAGYAPGEGPTEFVAVSAAEAAERGQLIPAYHPSASGQEGAAEADDSAGWLQGQSSRASTPAAAEHGSASFAGWVGSGGSVVTIDGMAEEELRASVDSGALSLLLGPDGRTPQGQQLRRLLSQVPAAGHTAVAAVSAGLSADAVARSLGLQRTGTVAALEAAFAGASGRGRGGASDALAETIKPRETEAEAADAGAAANDSWVPSSTYTVEQVEQGLASLLQQLLLGNDSSSSLAAASRQPAAVAAGPAGASAPTSKHYWQARADAVVPAAVVRAWELLEAQAGKRLATLQGRTGVADEVLVLRQENERLKSTLADLLNSPLNRELQLPPTLLLR